LNIFERIKRHAALASGSFASMFADVELTPLPAATGRLVQEISRPDPDVEQLIRIISASPELSAKIIQAINSARFALRNRVTTVRQAVALLGIRRVRAVALAFATMGAIPRPADSLFDHRAFWTDSLMRALLARAFARKGKLGEPEEAFTAMLLADVALPVLLNDWAEYYQPIMQCWQDETVPIAELERDEFKWDHAQAGAWILQAWGFPEEIVCFVGAHTLPREELEELGLEGTIASPMSAAALMPSVLKPCPERLGQLVKTSEEVFLLPITDLASLVAVIQDDLNETLALFGVQPADTSPLITQLTKLAESAPHEEAA
jgi:HD-like signal output (HDOD) protein